MKTIDKKDLKQRLLDENIIEFDNLIFCERTQTDDYRGGTIEHRKSPAYGWMGNFIIWFNGEIIHSSKTYLSAYNRLLTLFNKWHLEFKELDNENN